MLNMAKKILALTIQIEAVKDLGLLPGLDTRPTHLVHIYDDLVESRTTLSSILELFTVIDSNQKQIQIPHQITQAFDDSILILQSLITQICVDITPDVLQQILRQISSVEMLLKFQLTQLQHAHMFSTSSRKPYEYLLSPIAKTFWQNHFPDNVRILNIGQHSHQYKGHSNRIYVYQSPLYYNSDKIIF